MVMRQLLLYLSRRKDIENFLIHNPVAQKACRRFVAGETRKDAINAALKLQSQGFKITFDYLGEEVLDSEDAKIATEEYCALLNDISKESIDAGVSVKLSHLGIRIDEKIARSNLCHIVTRASDVKRFVRVDMEGSDLTEQTIETVVKIHRDYPNNIGTVLQSCLRRSDDDIQELIEEKVSVRLVKGAYLEPEDIAFQEKEDVDLHYMRLIERLVHSGMRPAFATHDRKLLDFAIDLADIFGVEKNWYEFQFLYGIRKDIQEELIKKGYRVRIYLPYGENWYGYLMRRLAERPANLAFFIKNVR